MDDALRYLDLKNLNDVIPGMGVPLMPHQAMGTRWMVEKERSSYQGGCLADEMGLGKVDESRLFFYFIFLCSLNAIVDHSNVRASFSGMNPGI